MEETVKKGSVEFVWSFPTYREGISHVRKQLENDGRVLLYFKDSSKGGGEGAVKYFARNIHISSDAADRYREEMTRLSDKIISLTARTNLCH